MIAPELAKIRPGKPHVPRRCGMCRGEGTVPISSDRRDGDRACPQCQGRGEL